MFGHPFKSHQFGYLNPKKYKIEPNADLRGADLSNTDLTGADLRGADLEGAKLHGTRIDFANFRGANLRGVEIHQAGSQNEDGEFSNDGVNFQGADLTGAKISDTEFLNPNFRNVKAQKIRITNSYFRGPDMRDADFSQSTWKGQHAGGISQNGERHADLRGTTFRGSRFTTYRILDADLRDTDFTASKFTKISFSDNYYGPTRFDSCLFRSVGFGDYGHNDRERAFSFKKASFNGAVFEKDFIFQDVSVMSESLRKLLKSEMEQERIALDEIRKRHPSYMGKKTGLWVHMTGQPFLFLSRTELSVSPYKPNEPYYANGPYGIIFKGTAHLFDTDVNTINPWSKFGFLKPEKSGVEDDPEMLHKEGILYLPTAEIVGLEINVSTAYPDTAKEYTKLFKRAGLPVRHIRSEEDRGKSISWL
jgi:uncharacterized protein YjbI with pentapeptide repeats